MSCAQSSSTFIALLKDIPQSLQAIRDSAHLATYPTVQLPITMPPRTCSSDHKSPGDKHPLQSHTAPRLSRCWHRTLHVSMSDLDVAVLDSALSTKAKRAFLARHTHSTRIKTLEFGTRDSQCHFHTRLLCLAVGTSDTACHDCFEKLSHKMHSWVRGITCRDSLL